MYHACLLFVPGASLRCISYSSIGDVANAYSNDLISFECLTKHQFQTFILLCFNLAAGRGDRITEIIG